MRRLVIRPGAIGDFILSLPAIEHLQPDEVWTTAVNAPLVRFARARSIASTGLDLLGITEDDLPALHDFDEIVSWYGANRPEFRELVQALGLPFRFLTALPPDGTGTHATDFYAAQVGAPACAIARIPVPPVPCRGTAVIHPFASSPKKRWPLERFRELAAGLDLPVEWCAGPEDDLPGAVHIADLYELAQWIAGARLFIGNDSGITHLAAAVGVQVIAIFRSTDPAVWAPRGKVDVKIQPAEDLRNM